MTAALGARRLVRNRDATLGNIPVARCQSNAEAGNKLLLFLLLLFICRLKITLTYDYAAYFLLAPYFLFLPLLLPESPWPRPLPAHTEA